MTEEEEDYGVCVCNPKSPWPPRRAPNERHSGSLFHSSSGVFHETAEGQWIPETSLALETGKRLGLARERARILEKKKILVNPISTEGEEKKKMKDRSRCRSLTSSYVQ